jgi:hypothetical protein
MATNMLTAMDVMPTAADRIAVDQAAMNAAAFGDQFQAQKIQNRLLAMEAARKEKAAEGDQVMTNWLMGLNVNTNTPVAPPQAAPQRPQTPQAGPANALVSPPQPQGLPAPQQLPVNQLVRGLSASGLGQNALAAPSTTPAPTQNALAAPPTAATPPVQAEAAATAQTPPEERTVQSFLAKVPDDIKQKYPEQALAWAQGQVAYYDQQDKQRETMFKDYVMPFAKSAIETGNNALFHATLDAGIKSGIPTVVKMAQALKDSNFQITGKQELKSQPTMNAAVRKHLLEQTTDPLVQETINGIKDGERVEIVQKMGKIAEIKPVKDIDANSKTPYQQARDLVKETLASKGIKREPTEKEIQAEQLKMTQQKTQVTVNVRGQEHDREAKQKAKTGNANLSDKESDALAKAIASGQLNADRVNSRSAKVLAKLLLKNPNLDLQNSAQTAAAGKKVEMLRSQLQPFEIKANKMFDRVEVAYRKNPQKTLKILNQLKTDFNTTFTGDPATVILGRQIRTAMIEYAKVINGSTGGAAVTDSARAEVETLLNQADRPETFHGSIKNERLAMKDAMSGYSDTLNMLKTGRDNNVRNLDHRKPHSSSTAPKTAKDYLAGYGD